MASSSTFIDILGSAVGKANVRSVSDVNEAKPCEDVGRQGPGKRPQREDLLPKSWLSDTCGARKNSACFFAWRFRACRWRCGGLPLINFVADREEDDWKLWHEFGSLYVLWCFTPLGVAVVSGAWRTLLTHFLSCVSCAVNYSVSALSMCINETYLTLDLFRSSAYFPFLFSGN